MTTITEWPIIITFDGSGIKYGNSKEIHQKWIVVEITECVILKAHIFIMRYFDCFGVLVCSMMQINVVQRSWDGWNLNLRLVLKQWSLIFDILSFDLNHCTAADQSELVIFGDIVNELITWIGTTTTERRRDHRFGCFGDCIRTSKWSHL